MDAARRGRVTPASVVLHCILRDTLFRAECNVQSTLTCRYLHGTTVLVGAPPPSTATYKGERKSDPFSSLLTSLQDAVKGGDHFESMDEGGRVKLSLMLTIA